jgi:hypothetical protein
LALAVNGVIDDYCVGFYTTLLPKKSNPRYSVVQDVLQCLIEFEKNVNNHHMLIYRREDLLKLGKTNVIRGIEILNKEDEIKFKELASMLKNYARFPSYGGKDSVDFVCRFLKDKGLGPSLIELLKSVYETASTQKNYEQVVDCAYLFLSMEDRARARRAWKRAKDLAENKGKTTLMEFNQTVYQLRSKGVHTLLTQ